MDTTFGGRLIWDIASQSMATDAVADVLQKAIIEAVPDLTEMQKGAARELCYMLSCSKVTAAWKVGEPVILKDFAERVTDCTHQSPETLWLWRYNMPYTLLNAWRTEFNKAQDIFPVPPEQLPIDALTPDQLKELEDKKSPLA